MYKLLFCITTVALLAACRSTKKITTAVAKKDSTPVVAVNTGHNDSVAFIQKTITNLQANSIQYTTFSAKVNVDYRDDADKHYDLNAVIRMYKDSALWMSANAVLGIEAMRVLITKDSVKLLNKLDKVYTARSVDYLQEVTALPLDLKTVQDLIIGNPVFFNKDSVAGYTVDAGVVSLISANSLFKNLLVVLQSDATLQRSKLDDVDRTRNRTAELTYNDYETKRGGPQFAAKRRITVAEKKKLDVRLDFKQYDFNEPVSFPFSIPKNYDRN